MELPGWGHVEGDHLRRLRGSELCTFEVLILLFAEFPTMHLVPNIIKCWSYWIKWSGGLFFSQKFSFHAPLNSTDKLQPLQRRDICSSCCFLFPHKKEDHDKGAIREHKPLKMRVWYISRVAKAEAKTDLLSPKSQTFRMLHISQINVYCHTTFESGLCSYFWFLAQNVPSGIHFTTI